MRFHCNLIISFQVVLYLWLPTYLPCVCHSVCALILWGSSCSPRFSIFVTTPPLSMIDRAVRRRTEANPSCQKSTTFKSWKTSFNPLSPNIHIQFLTFPLRNKSDNLIKDENIVRQSNSLSSTCSKKLSSDQTA